jgi:hypothetical protein
MTPIDETTFSGTVTEIFAHRFVVATKTGKILADLGPKGADRIALKTGDAVELSGEMKPSELKVGRIARAGETPIAIEHKKPHLEARHPADPAPALKTVAINGFSVRGLPRRKPKHFEILGCDKAGDFVEFHVELDGALRKTKPVDGDDPKWAAEIGPG